MDLQNTQVAHYPLTIVDPTSSTAIPVPAGDVFTPIASSASVTVTVGLDAGGNQELVVAPAVIASNPSNGGGNITVSVSDSAGDTVADLSGADAINIFPVPVTPSIHIGSPTFSTQAAPTAPGP